MSEWASLRLIKHMGYKPNTSMINAIRNVEILKLVPDRKLTSENHNTIRSSSIKCVKYLQSKNIPFGNKSSIEACRSGDLECLKYINEQASDVLGPINILHFDNSHLHIWKELINSHEQTSSISKFMIRKSAVKYGKEFIDLLIQGSDTFKSFDDVIIYGTKDSIDHLFSLGYRFSPIYRYIVKKYISPEIISYLHDHGFIWKAEHLNDLDWYTLAHIINKMIPEINKYL